jgi:hypothetical protein
LSESAEEERKKGRKEERVCCDCGTIIVIPTYLLSDDAVANFECGIHGERRDVSGLSNKPSEDKRNSKSSKNGFAIFGGKIDPIW